MNIAEREYRTQCANLAEDLEFLIGHVNGAVDSVTIHGINPNVLPPQSTVLVVGKWTSEHGTIFTGQTWEDAVSSAALAKREWQMRRPLFSDEEKRRRLKSIEGL